MAEDNTSSRSSLSSSSSFEVIDIADSDEENSFKKRARTAGATSSPLPDNAAADTSREISRLFEYVSQILELHSGEVDADLLFDRIERAQDWEAEFGKICRELDSPSSATDATALMPTTSSPKSRQSSLFDKVRLLQAEFVDADPNWLFERLDAIEDLGAGVEQLRQELTAPATADLSQGASFIIDTAGDRVVAPENDDVDQLPGPSHRVDAGEAKIAGVQVEFLAEKEKEALLMIVQMFPDVDPTYVVKLIAEENRSAEDIVDSMTRDSQYPKLKARLEAQRREKRRQDLLDPEKFNLEEFLLVFEDPRAFFTDPKRNVSELYNKHAWAQLLNDFPKLRVPYVEKMLADNHHFYFSTKKAIQEAIAQSGGEKPRKRGSKSSCSSGTEPQYLSRKRTIVMPLPDQMEEIFFRELQFAVHEDEIDAHLDLLCVERERLVAAAAAAGLLEECQCCFVDEVLFAELMQCDGDRHSFCKTCVKRHALECVGQGRHWVPCLSKECDASFSIHSLHSLLPPNAYSMLLKRCTQEELRTAALDNLESCPFCDFAVIMPFEAQQYRLFKCQNPDCLRESCRLCKEVSHIPLRCEEVEKASETAMRTFVENKMAEAMIRQCSACGKRIIKEEGCNKMTCPCGQYMCYVCRAPLDRKDPYQHFNHPNASCKLHTNVHELHEGAAQRAGLEAKSSYLNEHPSMQEMRQPDLAHLLDKKQPAKRKDRWSSSSSSESQLSSSSSSSELDISSSDSDEQPARMCGISPISSNSNHSLASVSHSSHSLRSLSVRSANDDSFATADDSLPNDGSHCSLSSSLSSSSELD